MGVSYSSYLFVGAEVPRTHFYEVGNTANVCNHHGKQDKKFCGDCGRECYEEFEKVWKPVLTDLPGAPEEIWELLGGEDGDHHYLSRSGKKGPFGFYRFGYENDIELFGVAVTKMCDDDRFNVDSHSVVAAEIQEIVTAVADSFRRFKVEQTVRILSVQNCG